MLIYTDKERRMLYMGYDVLEVCRHVINYSNEKEYGISNLKLQKVLYPELQAETGNKKIN